MSDAPNPEQPTPEEIAAQPDAAAEKPATPRGFMEQNHMHRAENPWNTFVSFTTRMLSGRGSAPGETRRGKEAAAPGVHFDAQGEPLTPPVAPPAESTPPEEGTH
jgi:hypothetical protein